LAYDETNGECIKLTPGSLSRSRASCIYYILTARSLSACMHGHQCTRRRCDKRVILVYRYVLHTQVQHLLSSCR